MSHLGKAGRLLGVNLNPSRENVCWAGGRVSNGVTGGGSARLFDHGSLTFVSWEQNANFKLYSKSVGS